MFPMTAAHSIESSGNWKHSRNLSSVSTDSLSRALTIKGESGEKFELALAKFMLILRSTQDQKEECFEIV